jgi:hypothetical protein
VSDAVPDLYSPDTPHIRGAGALFLFQRLRFDAPVSFWIAKTKKDRATNPGTRGGKITGLLS